MPQEFSLAALFILGLFSTLHCIGMCGGVVGALSFSLSPEVREKPARLFQFLAAYNLGRISSYALGGFIVGAIGMSLIGLIGRENAQLIARVLTASMMVLVGLYVAGWLPQMAKLDQLGSRLWRVIQPLGKRFLPVEHVPQAFAYGAVWGWLPCGLVYSALLLAALGGSAIQGGLGMLAFGLGTLPAMLATGFFSHSLTRWLQNKRIRYLFGGILIALGVMTLMMPGQHAHHGHHASENEKASHADQIIEGTIAESDDRGMKCGAHMGH